MKPEKQLAIAASAGKLPEVRRILKEAPSLAQHWQPLMDACFMGREEVVSLLLQSGADANVLSKSSHKYRPLHRTVESKKMTPRGPQHVATVATLLEHGADPLLRGTCTGITAIAVAALGGERQFLPLLTKGVRADIFMAAVLGDTAKVHTFLSKDPALAKAKDENGWNALKYAALSRLGVGDAKAQTALERVAAELLEAGAAPDGLLDPACWAGNLPMVRLLLQHGAKLEMGDTLNHAACDGQTEILDALVAAGADLNDTRGTEHHGGYTPFGCTITLGSERGARWFLDHGADPNDVGGGTGETALHLAIKRGCGLPLLRLLVERGARPGQRDSAGVTPLELARARKNPKAVAFLETALS